MESSSISNMAMHCPSTPSTILDRATSLGCNQIYQYHCLRNKDDKMVEKCLEVSWIQKEKCAVYDADAQKIDEWKCFRNLGICPQRPYLSNDVMSYSACVPSLTPKVPADGKDNTNTVTSKPPSDVSGVQPWIWVLIGVVILVVIAAIVVTFVKIIKRRKRSSSADSKEHHDEETAPLHNLTESNKDPCGAKGVNAEVLYYKTKTYEHLENRLINSALSIVVIGEPGSGKSVLGEMLHTRFRRQKINGIYYNARCLRRLEDTDNYPSHDHTKIVNILDNCFEIWNHYPHLITPSFKQIQRFHEKVVKCEGNCLVITVSKMNFVNNLDAAQRAQLKCTEQLEIVDLSEDFQLDIADKIGILEYHRNKQGLTVKRMDDFVIRKKTASIAKFVDHSSRLEFEFPLLCHLYYKHDSFQRGEEFFIVTNQIIKEYVKKLSRGTHAEKCQYCTLMYVVLHGGQIRALKKQDDTLLKGIAEVSKIDTSELEFNYGCCLITKGKNDETYEIIHEEMCKFLYSNFGERYSRMVIDKCEVEVLMKFVRTNDKSRRDVYRKMGFLIITRNFYDRLATRLQGIYAAKHNHAIFQDSDFCRWFKREGSGTNVKEVRCAEENDKTTEISHRENVVSSRLMPKQL